MRTQTPLPPCPKQVASPHARRRPLLPPSYLHFSPISNLSYFLVCVAFAPACCAQTRVGGYVTLQRAIVLDTLGYRDEAQKLYKQVRGHAVSEVSESGA